MEDQATVISSLENTGASIILGIEISGISINSASIINANSTSCILTVHNFLYCGGVSDVY